MLNLATHLSRSAHVFGGRTAISWCGTTLSYRTLDALSNRTAHLLRRLGVGPGESVALCCSNRPEFVWSYYAILKLGAVVVPLNPQFKTREFMHHLDDAQVRAMLCLEGRGETETGHQARLAWHALGKPEALFLSIADDVPGRSEEWDERDAGAMPAPAANEETPGAFPADSLRSRIAAMPATFDTVMTQETDTAVILYTSGTTGTPKGAELSHSNLTLNAAYSGLMQKADSRDVHLVALPLFHSFGQTLQMNAAVVVGAEMVLMPRFDPLRALQALAHHGVTLFAGVPAMYLALLDAGNAAGGPVDLAAVAGTWRLGMCGGSALPLTAIQAFEQQFGLTLLEGYGLSETSPLALFSFGDTPRLPGAVGYPLYGTETRLRPGAAAAGGEPGRGEVQLRGHHVMKGYYRRPDATRDVLADGWLSTGDIGEYDDEGDGTGAQPAGAQGEAHAGRPLRIVDRAKDLIIRGGYNIYPREIEELLLTHPAIAQAAVVGTPHGRLGEEVAACIVCRPGGTLEPADLVAWCKARMAAYKYPRIVQLRESLPRNATGKVLKAELRASVAAMNGIA